MAVHPEFLRRFNTLIAGEKQGAVALRLGVSPSYISKLTRGEYRPGRDLAERLIEAYDLPREEWLALMGFGRASGSETPGSTEELVQRVAEEAARRAREEFRAELAQIIGRNESPRQRYERRIGELYLRYSGEEYRIPSGRRHSTGGDWATDGDADRAVLVWLETLRELNPGRRVPELEEAELEAK